MKKNIVLLGFTALLFFTSCEEKMTEDEISQIGIQPCKKPAEFINKLGFDPARTAFSTDDAKIKGLTLIQFGNSPSDTINRKVWQDPSWSRYGWMGSITTDDNGNAYACPIPLINTFDNPVSTINRIYKVDHLTGEMKLFSVLPAADSVAGIVPYGPLGIYYDCHGGKIYVASVAGSTRDEEKGVIYMLNKETGKIEDELKGYDAMGLCVGGVTGTKKLYFGRTRSSDIYTVELTKSGHFKGKPSLELTLDQLGPRGDDKARRIRFDKNGKLLVHGVEFNYSLAAASQKPETAYLFTYYSNDHKWNLTQSQ